MTRPINSSAITCPWPPVLAKAETLIKNGKGNTVMQHVGLLSCADTSATANAFVSYYGPKARVDTPELIKKIQAPTLVVVTGKDEVVVGLDNKNQPPRAWQTSAN